jgi:hypothetical protein
VLLRSKSPREGESLPASGRFRGGLWTSLAALRAEWRLAHSLTAAPRLYPILMKIIKKDKPIMMLMQPRAYLPGQGSTCLSAITVQMNRATSIASSLLLAATDLMKQIIYYQ